MLLALGRLESELGAESAALGKALDRLRATTQAVLSSNDLALGLANATIYLDAFGHVLIGWMWLWQATVATRALRAGAEGEERSFYAGKLAACRYFFRYELPKVDAAFILVSSLDDVCLSFEFRGSRACCSWIYGFVFRPPPSCGRSLSPPLCGMGAAPTSKAGIGDILPRVMGEGDASARWRGGRRRLTIPLKSRLLWTLAQTVSRDFLRRSWKQGMMGVAKHG